MNGKPEPEALSRDSRSVRPETQSVDLDDPLLQQLAQAPALPTEMPEAIGPYRVLERLGQGGMGTVYRAEHAQTGQQVALKTVRVPNQQMLASIRREIYTLAGMRHPGIVRIVDEGLHQGLPWYAMELLEGLTLRHHVNAVHREAVTEATGLAAGDASTPEWWTQSLAAWPRAQPAADRGGGPASGPGQAPDPPAGPPTGPDASPTIRTMLTLVRRLCAPLAYLHGEGLVHRDLKPDNVLVRAGWPILVDFGLATQHTRELSRDVLQVDGGVMGTALYISPEQVIGDRVDARADLYALGCILYELLTGRPPFLAERPEELLRKHLQQAPPRPSQLVAGVERDLDELVLRLLAKNPEERLGYAEDVAAALGRLGAEDGLTPNGPKPTTYLYRPRVAGRGAPLAALNDALRLTREGRSGLVLVSGESGVGKTRLLREFGQAAARQEGLVLSGECTETRGGPLEALRGPLHALADRCREMGPEETERLLGRRGQVLALYEPALADLPGHEAWPEAGAQDVAALPAEAARLRLFSYLAETFSALAEGSPRPAGSKAQPAAPLLILDDLQWADDLTVGFLEHWLRSAHPGAQGRGSVQIVGAYRPEDVGAAHASPLQRLIEAQGVARIDLGRLQEEDLGAMVGDMLALDPPPRSFVRFLLRQSEGNPFFVGEYLRTAVAEGLLYRDPQGVWQVAEPAGAHRGAATAAAAEAAEALYENLPLPGSIQQLVGRRLAGLSVAARQLVDAAVVAGQNASAPLVRSIAGLGAVELLQASAEVLRRQVLEDTGGGVLSFVHDTFRKVALESLTPPQRLVLHQAAATGIEALHAGQLDEWAAALGHHWEQARQTAKARGYYLAGARRTRDRYAFDEAERLYRAALRLDREPAPESLLVRSELAMGVLEPRGRYEEAKAECRQALELARSLADRAGEVRILGDLAKICGVQGHMDEARALFEQALGLLSAAPATSDRGTAGHILAEFAILHHMQGRIDEAEALYRQALDLVSGGTRSAGEAATSAERRVEGRTMGNLAILYHEQGRIDEAVALYERALTIRRGAGDRRGEGTILGNLANLRRKQGRFDEALGLYQQALAVKREVGDREGEGFNLGNLANLFREQGRIDEALEHCRQALAVAREVGNRRLEGIVLTNLADLQLERGHPPEAHHLYGEALWLVRELGDRPGEGYLLCRMSILLRQARGRFEEAQELATEAEAILREVNDSLELVVCLCQQGHLALAQGRSGQDWLEKSLGLSATLDLGTESEINKAVDGLRRAQEAFEAGALHRLFRGKLLEDVSEGLRRWLAETRQMPGPDGTIAAGIGRHSDAPA